MTKEEYEARGRTETYSLEAYKELVSRVIVDILKDFEKFARSVKKNYNKMNDLTLPLEKRNNARSRYNQYLKEMLINANFINTKEYYEWSQWINSYVEPDKMLKEMSNIIDKTIPLEIRSKVKKFVFSMQEVNIKTLENKWK